MKLYDTQGDVLYSFDGDMVDLSMQPITKSFRKAKAIVIKSLHEQIYELQELLADAENTTEETCEHRSNPYD